jgi:hypothetical protein
VAVSCGHIDSLLIKETLNKIYKHTKKIYLFNVRCSSTAILMLLLEVQAQILVGLDSIVTHNTTDTAINSAATTTTTTNYYYYYTIVGGTR